MGICRPVLLRAQWTPVTSQSPSCHKGSSLTNEGLEHQNIAGRKYHWCLERPRSARRSRWSDWQKPVTMPGERRHRPTRRHKKHTLSRSQRAELQFPVSRVDRLLREAPDVRRLSRDTSVFFTGVLEYLTSNVLELASKEALNQHKVRITPEHVERAVYNGPLSSIFEDETHSRGDRMTSARK